MKIRIAEQIGQTLKIMWDQAPSCYNIQGFEFIYSKGWPLTIKRETTFFFVNVINVCYNVFSRLFLTSCILSISLLHFSAEDKVVKSEMFHEVQNWVILNDVEENTEYQLRLHTLYGNDPNNPIRSVASNFTFLIPEQRTIDIDKQINPNNFIFTINEFMITNL